MKCLNLQILVGEYISIKNLNELFENDSENILHSLKEIFIEFSLEIYTPRFINKYLYKKPAFLLF